MSLNRRLPNEIALIGGDKWDVTIVAPSRFHGDLREINVEKYAEEICRLETVETYFSRYLPFFLYGLRLRKILQQHWDLVHCWEEPYILAGGQIAWWTPKRTPLVFWTGQSTLKKYPPPFAQIEQYCLDRCLAWMARGESGVQMLLQRGYGRKPHRTMPLGVDIGQFRPDRVARDEIRSRIGFTDSGPPVVGFLGRFVQEKGLHLLTRALDKLEVPWRALLVGGGPLEWQLRAWAARCEDRVRIVTGVSHEQVPAYLNAMDLLCAPSQTVPHWREIFGRMIIEAFACGVPVVASDSGEIPNVVCEAGAIVSEGDETGWVRALKELISDSNLRAELSRRGYERATTFYAWPVVARRQLEFFTELLDGLSGIRH